jgi:hypothetical protein
LTLGEDYSAADRLIFAHRFFCAREIAALAFAESLRRCLGRSVDPGLERRLRPRPMPPGAGNPPNSRDEIALLIPASCFSNACSAFRKLANTPENAPDRRPRIAIRPPIAR